MLQAQSPVRRRDLPALRLLVAMAVGLVSLAVLGQTQSALRAQGRERSMFVSVLDSSGAPVEGLATADFVIGPCDRADAAGGARRHERVGGLRHP